MKQLELSMYSNLKGLDGHLKCDLDNSDTTSILRTIRRYNNKSRMLTDNDLLQIKHAIDQKEHSLRIMKGYQKRSSKSPTDYFDPDEIPPSEKNKLAELYRPVGILIHWRVTNKKKKDMGKKDN